MSDDQKPQTAKTFPRAEMEEQSPPRKPPKPTEKDVNWVKRGA